MDSDHLNWPLQQSPGWWRVRQLAVEGHHGVYHGQEAGESEHSAAFDATNLGSQVMATYLNNNENDEDENDENENECIT